ncbi:sigma-E processing peptidase SpoIIGA [Sediminibacillus massiliensis]|uniref:sigma-E processing peptidase SpoIIGA n=1 Tax=Sediminibacillus massiliensis TaxID=1926277 RepID=UPI0009888416|nr:sigma-E processing peptidase SpoIIGA [Sediminibacillus massiliensis]
MTIYLDAVWLLNFLLDWMILNLTQWIVRDDVRRLRIMGGAVIASLLVPLSIYFPDSFVNSLVGKGVYSLLIVWSAFGYRNFAQFKRKLLSFYFVSFALGGGLVGIHFLIGQHMVASESGFLTYQTGFGDQISWMFVGIGFPVVWYFTKTNMDKHALEKFQWEQRFEVTLKLMGESHMAMGYMDSGNGLVDPFSNNPVVICDSSFMKNWFGEEELNALKEAQDQLDFDSLPASLEGKFHLVPYQGVGGQHRFMIVIKPELISLVYESKTISTSKVFVGIQFGDLAADGSYQCLLHPGILKHSVATSA